MCERRRRRGNPPQGRRGGGARGGRVGLGRKTSERWAVTGRVGARTEGPHTKEVKTMATGARHKSFVSAGTLYYKLNNWVTFGFDQSLYETHGVPGATGALPFVNGIPSLTSRDPSREGSTIFTF